MITVHEWKTDRFHESKATIEELLANPVEDSFFWIDFEGHDKHEENQILSELFEINPLAISDAQRLRHPPKFERFINCDFLLLKVFNDNPDTPEVETNQLGIFFSHNWIVTIHKAPILFLGKAASRISKMEFETPVTPFLVALLLGKQCSQQYMSDLLDLEDRLEELEELMFRKPNDRLLLELTSHKTRLRKLRRIHAYHKAVSKEIQKTYSIGTSIDITHHMTDMLDHFDRLYSLSSMYYDTSSDLIEGYLSVASHRLNNIMKVLTIITAIFVPLSFLAGVYGMNFTNMPETKTHYGYFVLLGVMACIAISLIVVFRIRKWL
jgi:magnesium transporter